MENPYIKQFPELMEGKTVLYVHGFGSSGQSGTVTRLRTVMPNARVLAPDLPVDPNEAIALLHTICQEEKPDLILVAGDIIDGYVRPLLEEDMAADFRQLNAPVVACLGNHEYITGIDKSLDFYRQAGITLLRDSTVTLGDLVIAGRDDRSNFKRKSVKQLIAGVDKSKFTILLDHQPYHLDRVEKAGVDFQLSGHTHRGQVWPISWITDHVYECSWGSYQRGHTHYYISSGLGIWGGKFRIGTQSEYVVATLKRTEK